MLFIYIFVLKEQLSNRHQRFPLTNSVTLNAHEFIIYTYLALIFNRIFTKPGMAHFLLSCVLLCFIDQTSKSQPSIVFWFRDFGYFYLFIIFFGGYAVLYLGNTRAVSPRAEAQL